MGGGGRRDNRRGNGKKFERDFWRRIRECQENVGKEMK